MEATSITQLLKSFCDYTHWKYAVFWKLNHYFPMTLTWGDGYYGYQKTNEAVESMRSDVNFENAYDVFASSIERTGGSGDYSVRLLMTEMSHLKYILGEGIVGEIALTGDHCWVSCEDIFTRNFNNNIISECPYEWLLQFSSGIKTIVLVPVLPHGVLQFGSFEAVAEDLAFVNIIKEKFNSICCKAANTTLLSSDINNQASAHSAPRDCLMDNLDESFSITNKILKAELSGCTSLHLNESTRLNPAVPSFIQDECFLFGEDQPETLIKAKKNEISIPSIGVSNDPRHIGQVQMKLNQMEERIWACSQLVNSVGVFGEISNETCSYSSKDMNEQQFSLDCELYKALEPVASGQTAESLSKYFFLDDTYSSSTLMSNEKEQDHIKYLQFPKERNAEYLLDSVVSKLDSVSDDTSSSISNSVMPSITTPREYITSVQPQSHSEESTLIVDFSDPKNNLAPAFVAKGRDDCSDLITSTSFDGSSSILINETHKEKVSGQMQPKRGSKLSGTGKKRARVGNTESPRPRDRQLVMDRMKELRELVPDGARCSIDNLLDRTIKHMLHLRNITNQAEKLKQCLLLEVPECKKKKITGSRAGRSCAFDLESELRPIIIEDLECTGNMLVEMICSEQGLFLEIANVIRQMELTILKGVLESRSNITWACFIVEVPRGFHRMDILCPLLHLLQLRRNPVSNRI